MTKKEVYTKSAIHGLIGGVVATGMGIFVASPKQIKWVFIVGTLATASMSFYLQKRDFMNASDV